LGCSLNQQIPGKRGFFPSGTIISVNFNGSAGPAPEAFKLSRAILSGKMPPGGYAGPGWRGGIHRPENNRLFQVRLPVVAKRVVRQDEFRPTILHKWRHL
jgi:hypothetical protein